MAAAGRASRLRRLLRHRRSSTSRSRGAWRRASRHRRGRPARAAQRRRAAQVGRVRRPGREPPGRRYRRLSASAAQWQTFLLYLKQAPFGEKDAIFGHDIGFYVFSLPMWQTVQTSSSARSSPALMLAAIVHLIMGGIDYKATPRAAGPGGAGGARGPGEAGDPASPFARAQRAAAPQIPQIDVKLGGRAVAHLSAHPRGDLRRRRRRPAVPRLEPAVLDRRRHLRRRLHRRAHPPAAHLRDAWPSPCSSRRALVWNIWRRHQWWPATIVVWIVVAHRAARHRAGRLPVAHRQPEPAHQGARVHRQQPGRHQGGLQAQRHHAGAARGQDAAHAAEARGQPAHAAATSACGTPTPW